MNDVAYRLALPETMPIHNVFHVSLLKAYKPGSWSPPPVPIEIDGELEYEIERILMHRERKTNKVTKKEYLIKWLGYGHEHCTWEPESNLKNAQELLEAYWKEQADVLNAAKRRQETKQSATRKRASSTLEQPSAKRQGVVPVVE